VFWSEQRSYPNNFGGRERNHRKVAYRHCVWRGWWPARHLIVGVSSGSKTLRHKELAGRKFVSAGAARLVGADQSADLDVSERYFIQLLEWVCCYYGPNPRIVDRSFRRALIRKTMAVTCRRARQLKRYPASSIMEARAYSRTEILRLGTTTRRGPCVMECGAQDPNLWQTYG